MGSVQRLATVVVLGFVGLASVLILYLADENNRIDQFAGQQQEAAVERGQATFLSQCIACHGPAGEGFTAQGEAGTARIGAPLGGVNTELNQTGIDPTTNLPWSDPLNPQFGNGLEGRYNYIVWRVHNGYRNPDTGAYIMPAFGSELNGPLNDSQIQELATFIQHTDWNETYNAAVALYGGYPTAAPKATVATTATAAATGGDTGTAGAATYELDMVDIAFQPTTLEIPADTDVTLVLKNTGALPHNFSIPDQNISQDVAAGATQQITLNLPAGTYSFDCDEPGHKEAGMVGTLTVTAGLAPPAGSTSGSDATPTTGGTPAAASPATAATPVELELQDIAFSPSDITIPANTDVKVELKNTGALPHNFSIDDPKISQDVAAGATAEVTLNLPAGTYQFYCDEPGHKEAGMVGTLTVTDAPAATDAEAQPTAAAADTQAPAAASSGPIELDMVDIAFDPTALEIPANTPVTVTLKNTGVLPHNFSIPDQNISVDVAAGATGEVTLNLPAGTYQYDCDEPGHKEAGMVGTLTVK